MGTGHEEMTIEEIMLGKGDYYPGLIPLVYAYLGHIGCDAETMDTVDQVWTVVALPAHTLTYHRDNLCGAAAGLRTKLLGISHGGHDGFGLECTSVLQWCQAVIAW